MESPTPAAKRRKSGLRSGARQFLVRLRTLQGDPHYIAKGMAIGVFVGITPTIPLHTVIAVALAFLLRASKPAAALGVWCSNPLTIPLLYFASYRVGIAVVGQEPGLAIKTHSITELLTLGLDATLAMMAGGVIIGILPAVAAYFVTRRVVARWRACAPPVGSEAPVCESRR